MDFGVILLAPLCLVVYCSIVSFVVQIVLCSVYCGVVRNTILQFSAVQSSTVQFTDEECCTISQCTTTGMVLCFSLCKYNWCCQYVSVHP